MKLRARTICWTLVTALWSALPLAAAGEIAGTWRARSQGDDVAFVLQMPSLGGAQGAEVAFTVPAGELSAAAGMRAPGAELRRDAGTFLFAGLVLTALPRRPPDAAGELSFLPNPRFAGEAWGRGARELSAADLFRLAFHDVGAGYVRELAGLGLGELGPREVADLKMHGVTAAYVRDLQDAGLSRLSAVEVVRLRMHRVDAETVRRLERQAGHELSVDELLRKSMHERMSMDEEMPHPPR
jgi:hypothetical protein